MKNQQDVIEISSDDEVTDLTKLQESDDDDIFAGPATHQVQAHKKTAAKKTERCRVTNSRSLESAKGQRMVTAAPRQGAAGGAPGGAPGGAAGGAAGLGGMKVMLSGDAGDAAASAATESDDHQDEAPIPAMASTSPQAVASCARMRVVPIDHSASSEKPAKELGKGMFCYSGRVSC